MPDHTVVRFIGGKEIPTALCENIANSKEIHVSQTQSTEIRAQ